MSNISTIGLDIAKSVFQVHGVDTRLARLLFAGSCRGLLTRLSSVSTEPFASIAVPPMKEFPNVKPTKNSPQSDAQGQFAKTQHGGKNDGVSSANPRVLSGKKDGDATFKSDAKENEKDRQAPGKAD